VRRSEVQHETSGRCGRGMAASRDANRCVRVRAVEPAEVEHHRKLARLEHRQCKRSLGQRHRWTFVRTTDRGETWQAGTVPGGEKLDFRNVYAVDATTAYLMSIGNGNESRIYKTTDAGKTWSLQYTEPNPKAFLDCMAFWNATRGIVVGDAVDGKSELLTTSDGGAHWRPLAAGVDASGQGRRRPRRPLGHASRPIRKRKGKMKPGTHGS